VLLERSADAEAHVMSMAGPPHGEIRLAAFATASATIVADAADAAMAHRGDSLRGARVVIQGFGAVGAAAARRLAELGAVLVAVSTARGAVRGRGDWGSRGRRRTGVARRWRGAAAARRGLEQLAECPPGGEFRGAGPVRGVVLVAVGNALLGMALGLLVSAFAATEFQAVQFMPQMLLCGLFVPREQMAAGLEVAAAALPFTYAFDALQAVARDQAGAALALDVDVAVGATLAALGLRALTLRRRLPHRP
jgi:hypothetical protein